MKNKILTLKRLLFILAISGDLFILSGCSAEIETLTFKSPDGDKMVTISGKQESGAGTIKVKVVVKVKAGEKEFFFEHQGSKLTKETVDVEWENNERGRITLKYDDGDSQVLQMILGDELVNVMRIK